MTRDECTLQGDLGARRLQDRIPAIQSGAAMDTRRAQTSSSKAGDRAAAMGAEIRAKRASTSNANKA